jgi:Mannosyltransferase putative
MFAYPAPIREYADPDPNAGAAEQLRQVVATEHPYPTGRFADRGIVICGGGARILTCAWVAINVLRRVVDCQLPIQLWHIGPGELGELEAALFGELDIEIVDALEVRRTWPARTLGGWELKPYALVNSRFEQALLLDADNVVVTDPEFLFELPEFARTGALFWPDLERLKADNPIWELCRVPFRSEPAWETGQLLVDKSRCWHALQIALHMNMHSELFYPHTAGDKETFHLAWLLANAGYAMPDHPARRTATGIYQRGFDGRILFQHRNTAKWRLSGWNLHADEFRYQSECLGFIAALRQRWSGSIGSLPPRSERDAETEDSLAQTRWFRLEQPPSESRLLELLAGNRVGVGSMRGHALRWYVREDVLTLDGADGVLGALDRQPDEGWVSAERDDQSAVRLIPAPDAGLDTLGTVAAAVLERFLAGDGIAEDDAVNTLSTLARVGDLTDAFQRARGRWPYDHRALRVLDQAGNRAGVRNPSELPRGRPGFEPIT